MQCDAVCRSVMQCDAAAVFLISKVCSVLQCDAVCCSVMQCDAAALFLISKVCSILLVSRIENTHTHTHTHTLRGTNCFTPLFSKSDGTNVLVLFLFIGSVFHLKFTEMSLMPYSTHTCIN